MISLLDEGLSLVDFLPESIASDPEIIALSVAIDPELRSVGAAIIEALIFPRIAELDDPILDELAWAFRLNRLQIWDTATTEGKRALLVNVFAIRKKSGTRFSVRRVFDLLSVVGTVIEWWEENPEGRLSEGGGGRAVSDPYTYRLRLFVQAVGITRAELVQIGELVHRFAPTRAFLSEFATETDATGPVLPYVAVTIGRHTTIPFGG